MELEVFRYRSLIHGLKQSYRKDVQRIKELILSSPKAAEPAVILDEASIDSFSFHPIGRIQTAFK